MWGCLHELSHYVALKLLRKDAKARLFPYPHVHDGKIFWARIEWTFAKPELSDMEMTIVYWAPRLTDFVGAVLFVISAHVSFNRWALVALILCGGSVVDTVVGSIGYDPGSDLKRVSRALQISGVGMFGEEGDGDEVQISDGV